jgi:hypothetical protein
LRNPHHTIVSLYKRINAIVKDFHEATGYKAAYEIFQKIVSSGARSPLILFSEELSSQPEEVVKTFCTYVGVDFIENSLSWQNLGENFSGLQEWHEAKTADMTQHWHGKAIQSTQFERLPTYAVDDLGNPTFEEIMDSNDRKECEKAYRDSLPYYSFFKEEAHHMTRITEDGDN